MAPNGEPSILFQDLLMVHSGMIAGAIIFRLVYTVALRFDMPAFMLKLVSSVIVVIAISGPYLKNQLPLLQRKLRGHRIAGGGKEC